MRGGHFLTLAVLLGGSASACGAIPRDLLDWTKYYSAGFGLDYRLVTALIWTESKYCQYDKNGQVLRSSRGALGLGQLLPSTAASIGSNPNDPVSNIYGTARYLRSLWDQFQDWPMTVAAYNAGPGAVAKYGGVPPYNQTVKYVNTVFATYTSLANLK